MAVKTSWSAGDVLAAADLTDTFAAKAPLAGACLQVVQSTYSTAKNSSTTSEADTGLAATITPKYSTSKILVMVSQEGCGKEAGNTQSALALYLYRGSTQLKRFGMSAAYTNSSMALYIGAISTEYLDSPGTTSAVTYKTTFANTVAASQVTVQTNSGVSVMTLMEIAA